MHKMKTNDHLWQFSISSVIKTKQKETALSWKITLKVKGNPPNLAAR